MTRVWQAAFSRHILPHMHRMTPFTLRANHVLVPVQHTLGTLPKVFQSSSRPSSFGSGASRLRTLATNAVNKSEQDTDVFLRHQASTELFGIEAWDSLHMPTSNVTMLDKHFVCQADMSPNTGDQ